MASVTRHVSPHHGYSMYHLAHLEHVHTSSSLILPLSHSQYSSGVLEPPVAWERTRQLDCYGLGVPSTLTPVVATHESWMVLLK